MQSQLGVEESQNTWSGHALVVSGVRTDLVPELDMPGVPVKW
jgi:hypothetical protein